MVKLEQKEAAQRDASRPLQMPRKWWLCRLIAICACGAKIAIVSNTLQLTCLSGGLPTARKPAAGSLPSGGLAPALGCLLSDATE